MGAQNYEQPKYQYHNNGVGHPAQTQQRPVLFEQDRYGQATDTGRERVQVAPSKETKAAGNWEVESGGEDTFSTPRTSGAITWRSKVDKMLLKIRASDRPASWSDIVGILRDNHTEDDARRRYDELETSAEKYGSNSKQKAGPKP